jgi:uncharacterized protein YabN with tetrapyrrole methylase and pyrophosphatase domain
MHDNDHDNENRQSNTTHRARGKPRFLLDEVDPLSGPLQKAHQIQQKCAAVGFDWNHPSGARAKVLEELQELDEALAKHDFAAMEWEMGDLLLAATNWARLLDLDTVRCLKKALDRFARRFRIVEMKLSEQGLSPSEVSLEKLEALWQQAKAEEKG